ncbi:MAG: hypothetical protein BM564_02410 [Bacteroidetes bacterium MedPE-SWsnd-G2]|nr:MAG: hypothetical protein BM564_02410 [Bacteroidetes bacterium MedPE-SWsnd-G2]
MKTKFLLIIMVLSSTMMVAQKKLADKFFDNYGYVKASELYLEAIEKGDSTEHIVTRLGDCYYNNSDSESAVKWYGLAINKYKNVEPEYIYKYLQSLKSLGNYEEASKWISKFKELQADDSRLSEFDADNLSIYEDLIAKKELIVEVENLSFNTKQSDFGSFIYDNTLYFASANNRASESKKVYNWNQEPFLDLFQINFIGDKGNLEFESKEEIKASKINTDYHEASVAITGDGKTIYFTRDNVDRKNNLDYDKKGTSHLKIYKAELVNENWENIEELNINDDVYSTGHPVLSPDNTKLYFVSDRPGGFGQTDIYVSNITAEGLSEPENLGESINTEGREMFPFISKDSTFYFSSDGYLNLGLLDIFKSDVLKDDAAKPENLGAPFNSGFDDFAFFIMEDNQTGFFSSNRPNGKGNDDIYSFNSYICSQEVNGTVRDTATEAPIPFATVKLIDENGKVISKIETDENGFYTIKIDCNSTYTIIGSKQDYKEDQKELETTDENGIEQVVDLNLEPLIKQNQIVINPIFFDFDKWNIRTDAKYELEHIVDVMRANPKMVIKIESHTDSRGSDKYNLKLSDRRAKSTRDYIISRGIDAQRIESAIGYGETQLLNKCSNGVKCSKEEHQLNRRSYFYIL